MKPGKWLYLIGALGALFALSGVAIASAAPRAHGNVSVSRSSATTENCDAQGPDEGSWLAFFVIGSQETNEAWRA